MIKFDGRLCQGRKVGGNVRIAWYDMNRLSISY